MLHPKRISIGSNWFPFFRKGIALRHLKRLLPLSMLKRHCYVVAKSGSGKSELLKLLILRLKQKRGWWGSRIDRSNTAVLTDPHGETAFQCAAQKIFKSDFQWSQEKKIEPNLVYVSPSTGKIPCLNPFDLGGKAYSTAQLEILAQFLTRTFSSMLGRGERALTLNMQTLLFPMLHVLLGLSALYTNTPKTFRDLALFLDDRTNSDLVQFGAEGHQSPGQNRFFRTMFHDPLFNTTKFSLRTKLASLMNAPMFERLLCQEHSTWDLASLLGSGRTVIIDASKTNLGAEVSEVYGRTITALIQGYTFLSRNGRNPTFLILDEASTFVSDDLRTILAELRKFGLHLTLVSQTSRMSKSSRELHEGVLGNTAVRMVGNVGEASRVLMAKECGVSKEVLEGLRVGEFLIQVDGRKPVIAKLPPYWLNFRTCTSLDYLRNTQTVSVDFSSHSASQGKPKFAPRYGTLRPF